MKFHPVHSILLGIATLSPCLLFAQTDPTPSPASQTQPGRPPQQMPPSQQDSGPNAGDVGQVMQDKIFLDSTGTVQTRAPSAGDAARRAMMTDISDASGGDD